MHAVATAAEHVLLHVKSRNRHRTEYGSDRLKKLRIIWYGLADLVIIVPSLLACRFVPFMRTARNRMDSWSRIMPNVLAVRPVLQPVRSTLLFTTRQVLRFSNATDVLNYWLQERSLPVFKPVLRERFILDLLKSCESNIRTLLLPDSNGLRRTLIMRAPKRQDLVWS